MTSVIKGCKIYQNGKFISAELVVQKGRAFVGSPCVFDFSAFENISLNNCLIFPGFVDVHVHLREPGFSYKAKIFTETRAAASKGYTDICPMPNLNPVPDSIEHLKVQLDLIEKNSAISCHPYGSITVSQNGQELSDMKGMAKDVVAFSDDGKGLQNDEMMLQAMKTAKSLDKIIVAHCEVNSLLKGGYIHDGEYAEKHNHKGICSQSEYEQIARDLELVEQTGCKYHICHISTKESVDLIRNAKAKGLDVTCETAPHYLLLDENDLQEDGRFKMNPPLRSSDDKKALINGILDGTIDMIATDHAPHSAEEKSKGLEKSAFGIVGLETAFPLLYTYLVKKNVISLEKLIELMSINPAKRFNIKSGYENGNFCVYDLEHEETIKPDKFLSMGKATPFTGYKVNGKCKMTVCKGETVWNAD